MKMNHSHNPLILYRKLMEHKIITTLLSITLFCLLASCSDLSVGNLEELNQNPHASETLNPNHMFTNAQLSGVTVNWGHAHLMYGQSMQFFSTYFEIPARGDKFFVESGARGHWGVYTNALHQIDQVMRHTTEPEDINKHSAARIWKVYLFHQLTDLHGDVPYSEALKSQDDLITPRYDTQEDIYIDMLNELEEAANAFNSSHPTFGSSDLFYNGNIAQWQRFAYSMMLRLGMRLTEVRPDLAEEYVTKAINGGVILDDSDITMINYTGSGTVAERSPKAEFMLNIDYRDPQANRLNREGGKYAETFIEHLKDTEDPRLSVVAVVWVDNPDGGQPEVIYDTTPEIQRGMPNGQYGSLPDYYQEFSEPHPNTVLNTDSPVLVMTNAETNLLLAEASIRGWYAGSAEEAYNEAVRAGMRQWELFGDEGTISEAAIEEYLVNNPYMSGGTFDQRLEQISIQKWTSLFLDFYEIFANWRRTGYPELIPPNYPGNLTGGQIPRRNIIPDSEINLNEQNFMEALNRQGVGNDLLSSVWWDPMFPGNQ